MRKLYSSSSLSSEDISDHSSIESVSNHEESPVPEIRIQNAPSSKYSKCKILIQILILYLEYNLII